eukprot:TRINITY_DN23398_c0_g1_i5.p1 TRINITY_DN23398_c0_g1~~TRINITY_DN23398_c0_g1_i5.p1  ORF type:complete len:320 (+),score=75.34 TRINITY_DN23398_c0_g1_i5:144-1103(+)
MLRSLVGSEMCIRDRVSTQSTGEFTSDMPHTAYIVAAKRTAGGKRNGSLSGWHPADLGATVIDAMLDETRIDPSVVDDVIFGCVCQNGAQAGNIGRSVVLSSKLPQSVPGVSVDRQCGSSQQSIHFAAQAVMSGVQDVVIAGGVEVMSLVPIGSNVTDGLDKNRGFPNGERIQEKYGAELERRGMAMFSQFDGAEIMCEKYDVNRAEMEQFALSSHHKAVNAQKNGYFDREVVPLPGKNLKGEDLPVHANDQGVRPNISLESMQKMKTLSDGVPCRLHADLACQRRADSSLPHLPPRWFGFPTIFLFNKFRSVTAPLPS